LIRALLIGTNVTIEQLNFLFMKYLLLCACILAACNLFAQDETIKKLKSDSEKEIKKDPADTASKIWKTGGTLGFTLAQGSLSNWAAGGDEFSLSLNALASFFAYYKKDKHSWDNTIDFNLGYVRTTSLGSRKNDDRFDILSKYGYALGPKLNLTGLFNFRTQFFKGYTYTNDVRTFTSEFMSPGYILLSPGLDWKPATGLSIFVSPITGRWVVVTNDSLSAAGMYGVEPGENVRTEYGAFLSTTYTTDMSKTVSYKGRMDLFSNYRENPGNIDLFMTNLFAVKLTKIISLTWSLDFIYDDDVRLFGPNKTSAALQVKSMVGAGILLKY
jgi:Protein of unknown function (DUF3078)